MTNDHCMHAKVVPCAHAHTSRGCVSTSRCVQDGVLVRRAQKNRAGPVAGGASRTLQVGKLVDFNWRLGVGVASSACTDLAAPFVTIQLTIADSFGKVSVKTMELTTSQFQVRIGAGSVKKGVVCVCG
jgi:hypothetical protein